MSHLNQDFCISLSLKLVLLLGVLNDLIVKVIKLLYNIVKVDNYYFAIYYLHYEKNLK